MRKVISTSYSSAILKLRSLSSFLFSILVEVLASTIRQAKEIKNIYIERKKKSVPVCR